MRGTYLLTGEAETELMGLMTVRHAVCGLIPKQTTQSEWQALLGTPDASMVLDAQTAEVYRLSAGISDSYSCGAYTLTLHADENGVLEAIILGITAQFDSARKCAFCAICIIPKSRFTFSKPSIFAFRI